MCGTGGRRADVVHLGILSERAGSAYLVPALGKSLAERAERNEDGYG